ncbi:MAG: MFS transporter [Actinomycetota bacterium]
MLALTAAALFLVSLDLSIVVVAKRTIDEELGGGSLLTWVFSAYAIAYAAALLTAGRFADVFGRKRSFLRGVLWFSFGSLLCGFAPTAWFLVLARVVQAFGGAQLSPAKCIDENSANRWPECRRNPSTGTPDGNRLRRGAADSRPFRRCVRSQAQFLARCVVV